MMQWFKTSRVWSLRVFAALFALSFYFFFFNTPKPPDSSTVAFSEKILSQFGKLPLYFEKNEGQVPPDVFFLSRSLSRTIFFEKEGLTVNLQNAASSLRSVKMRFAGANSQVLLDGIERLEKKSNYLMGSEASQWITGIPNFAKVNYHEIYPGIDALFYGQEGQLEYDFNVAPGSDPHAIRLLFEGADELYIDAQGNLKIVVEGQELLEIKKPFTYQLIDGHKKEVASSFVLLAKQEIGCALGAYCSDVPLVIDPTLLFSTYMGGGGGAVSSSIKAVTVDSSGSAYVAGQSTSTSFPVTGGAFQTVNGGGSDAVIAKFNAQGTDLIFSTYLGGSALDSGNAIALDSDKNVYVTGTTQSSDFPVTPGSFQSSLVGFQDAFIAKLNPNGSGLIYSTYLGGDAGGGGVGITEGFALAVDNSYNAYLTGQTFSTLFPTSAGAFQSSCPNPGGGNAFVAKLNTNGSALIYSTYLAGSAAGTSPFDSLANSIAVDAFGCAYLTGWTSSSSFPTTPQAYQTTLNGEANAFVSKLTSDGSDLVYSTLLGGSDSDNGYGIALDNNNQACITGVTTSANFPVTASAYQTTLKGSKNAFITQLNADASALVYSTYLGGSSSDQAKSIALDSHNNAYTVGYTTSSDFPVTADAFQSSINAAQSGYFSVLDSTGAHLVYSTFLGGSSNVNQANAIVVDATDQAYIAGVTNSSDFPVTPDAYQSTAPTASENGFLTKFAMQPVITYISPSFGSVSGGTSVTITGSGFTGVLRVSFGTTEALSFNVISDTEMIAVSPPHAPGVVDVTISAPFVSAPSPANQFTYHSFSSINLQAQPNPAEVGQTVALKATVTPDIITGEVSFFDGTTLIGRASINNGEALFSKAFLSGGSHLLTAVYAGDAYFPAATSSSVDLVVTLKRAHVKLKVTPNPLLKGNRALLKVNISPADAKGAILFFEGPRIIGTKQVHDGKAKFLFRPHKAGKYYLQAVYEGDKMYAPSRSPTIKLQVDPWRCSCLSLRPCTL